MDEYAIEMPAVSDEDMEDESCKAKGARPWDDVPACAPSPPPQTHPFKPNGRLRLDRAVYRPELLPFKEVWSRVTSKRSLELIRRMIVCSQADAGQVDALRAAVNASRYPLPPVGFSVVPPSGWKGLLRNVRSADKVSSAAECDSASTCAVMVSLTCAEAEVDARTLCLCGIKYAGNVGTIIRSAVQSNVFSSIALVQVARAGESGSDSNKTVSDDDINWYSLQNAPLVNVQKFPSVDAYLASLPPAGDRKMVAVEITDKSLDLYSNAALECLRDPRTTIVMGAEDVGTPVEILKRCDATIEIPSMSASVNVSCAFSNVLSVVHMADRGANIQ